MERDVAAWLIYNQQFVRPKLEKELELYSEWEEIRVCVTDKLKREITSEGMDVLKVLIAFEDERVKDIVNNYYIQPILFLKKIIEEERYNNEKN